MKTDKKADNLNFIFSIFLVIALFIPGLATFLDILEGPDSERQESIARTPRIELNLQSLSKLPGDIRFYIKERFGFKDNLVTYNGLIKKNLFGSSPYVNVIQGKDNFLFLGVAEAIDFTQGVSLFSKDELKIWLATINKISTRVQALDARYELIITPNKHSIYADKLPPWVDGKKTIKTRSDMLLKAGRAMNLPVHGSKTVLKQHLQSSKDKILYYKTDTHWNEYGASLAVNYLLSELGHHYLPEAVPVPVVMDKAGDLARMIGQQHSLKENAWTATFADSPDCRLANGKSFIGNQTDPIQFDRLTCENKSAPDVKAVVFIDSFGVSMVPSLSVAFRNVLFLWQYEIDYSEIRKIEPDYVIHQITERTLQSLDPREF